MLESCEILTVLAPTSVPQDAEFSVSTIQRRAALILTIVLMDDFKRDAQRGKMGISQNNVMHLFRIQSLVMPSP